MRATGKSPTRQICSPDGRARHGAPSSTRIAVAIVDAESGRCNYTKAAEGEPSQGQAGRSLSLLSSTSMRDWTIPKVYALSSDSNPAVRVAVARALGETCQRRDIVGDMAIERLSENEPSRDGSFSRKCGSPQCFKIVGSHRGWHLRTTTNWTFRSCLTWVAGRFVSRLTSFPQTPADTHTSHRVAARRAVAPGAVGWIAVLGGSGNSRP